MGSAPYGANAMTTLPTGKAAPFSRQNRKWREEKPCGDDKRKGESGQPPPFHGVADTERHDD